MTETFTIPGYTIQSKLGQGSMAAVYRAVQGSDVREIALKVMSPQVNADRGFGQRLVHAAALIDQIKHPSMVPIYEIGEYESRHYLVTEYLAGGDLRRRLAGGAGDPVLAVHIILTLAPVLDIAHSSGLVHLDIRPGNILFRKDGIPALSDFGVLAALEAPEGLGAGVVAGLPTYMSPEALKGLDVDGRSDLYSLGIVFYEILTGRPPFDAGSSLLKALKRVHEPLPRLPPQHAEYQEFLDQLTAKDRTERFASGAAAVTALRSLGHRSRRNSEDGEDGGLRPAQVLPASPAATAAAAPNVARSSGPATAPVPPASGVTDPMPAAATPMEPQLARGFAPVVSGLAIAAALGCTAMGVHLIVNSV